MLAPERRAWVWHLTALGFYACLSWLIIDHGADLNGPIFGHGADPYLFIWFLAWFPFAIMHHLNLFWSHFVWQPFGLALLWMTSVPLLAIPAGPLTSWLGPVRVYNLLVMAAPVLSAWCMYRLCLRLSGRQASALIGGFLFGFSTYEMAQAVTPNLSFTFLLPCLGWILLARAQGAIGRGRAAGLLALTAIAQFLISTEIFAITVLFSAIIWALAYLLAPAMRGVLGAVLGDATIAAGYALVALSPFLVSMFSVYPYIRLPALWPYFFAASPTGFFVPGPNTWLSWKPAYRLVNDFLSDRQEQDSYLGVPLLAILYIYARQSWHHRPARVLSLTVLTLLILSLGPQLWLGQNYTSLRLPWAVLMRLPLLDGALPVRFALFVTFFTALVVTLWIEAGDITARGWRIGAALLACLAIWPSPRAQTAQPVSTFFAPGRVAQLLGKTPQILILPYALQGPSSFWQVESGFAFTQTGGYLGFPPRAMQHYRAILELASDRAGMIKPQDVADFVQRTGTSYIVAGPGTPPAVLAVIEELHWQERQLDDVTIFDVPAAKAAGG